jgi:hypothetical protein
MANGSRVEEVKKLEQGGHDLFEDDVWVYAWADPEVSRCYPVIQRRQWICFGCQASSNAAALPLTVWCMYTVQLRVNTSHRSMLAIVRR